MERDAIELGDWQRILFGKAPLTFMAEVFLRTLCIYIVLIIALRLLGKRMNGQLTISELGIMITLGAIVAVPMQAPDRGLLPGILLLGCVLVMQRGLSWLTQKSRVIRRVTRGSTSLLVKDGCLNLQAMREARVSQAQLFGTLRSKAIRHLGQVRRVYLEACGRFSVFKSAESRAGLSILPPKDKAIRNAQPRAEHDRACARCGQVEADAHHGFVCAECGHGESLPAVR